MNEIDETENEKERSRRELLHELADARTQLRRLQIRGVHGRPVEYEQLLLYAAKISKFSRAPRGWRFDAHLQSRQHAQAPAFQPWPAEDAMRRGVLAASHSALDGEQDGLDEEGEQGEHGEQQEQRKRKGEEHEMVSLDLYNPE